METDDYPIGKIYKVLFPLTVSEHSLYNQDYIHLEIEGYVVILEFGLKKNMDHIVTLLVGKQTMYGCVRKHHLHNVFERIDDDET